MHSTLRIGIPIQGPAGATGATGAQGPMGPSGAQGSQGAQGIQGEPGDTGPATSNNWITVDAGATKASWSDLSSVDASGAFTALTTFTTSSAGRTIKLVTDPTTHAWTGTYQASSGICCPVSGSWTWGFRFGVAVKATTANAYITVLAAYVDTADTSLYTDINTSKFFGVGIRNSAAVLWGDNTDHLVGAIDWDTGGSLTNNAVFTHMRDSTIDAFLSYNATNNTLSAYMAPIGQTPMKVYDYSLSTGHDAGYLTFLIYQGGGGANQAHNVVIYGAESLSNVPGWD